MEQYANKMKLYLKEAQPAAYKRMKAAGELTQYCELRGRQAGNQFQELVESGMPDYMAQEIVLKDLMTV